MNTKIHLSYNEHSEYVSAITRGIIKKLFIQTWQRMYVIDVLSKEVNDVIEEKGEFNGTDICFIGNGMFVSSSRDHCLCLWRIT